MNGTTSDTSKWKVEKCCDHDRASIFNPWMQNRHAEIACHLDGETGTNTLRRETSPCGMMGPTMVIQESDLSQAASSRCTAIRCHRALPERLPNAAQCDVKLDQGVAIWAHWPGLSIKFRRARYWICSTITLPVMQGRSPFLGRPATEQ